MWVASKYGFFSAIARNGLIEVRARVKRDLENLIDFAWHREIVRTIAVIEDDPKRDYRYRIRVTPECWALIAMNIAREIDYENFKNKIKELPDQKEKIAAYMATWSALLKLQPHDGSARILFKESPRKKFSHKKQNGLCLEMIKRLEQLMREKNIADLDTASGEPMILFKEMLAIFPPEHSLDDWVIYVIVQYHGNRYEPPSEDYKEVARERSLMVAAKRAILILKEISLDNEIEAIEWEESAPESEQ